MKVGDLVYFYSHTWVFQRDDYANPGVIIAEVQGTQSYRVMWNNHKVTIEHMSYLNHYEESRE